MDWFIELALPDIVEPESVARLSAAVVLDVEVSALDIVGLDTALVPGEEVLSLDDSIFPSVAQPPTISPKRAIQIAFLSMVIPPHSNMEGFCPNLPRTEGRQS